MTDTAQAIDTTASEQPATGRRIFTSYLFRGRSGSDVVFSQEPPPAPPEPTPRPARVARMLALAHRLQRAIDRGEYRDRAELARQFGVTRARVTQLLNLTLLAPDIQADVLALEAVDGVQPTSERALRQVVAAVDWEEQRKKWTHLRNHTDGLPAVHLERQCPA